MNEYVTVVTDETFDHEVLQSESPVIVDFWATWCGPCRMFAPVFSKVAEEYVHRVKMVKANVDDTPETAARYGIRSIPTLIIFNHGQMITTKTGALSEAQLKDFIADNI